MPPKPPLMTIAIGSLCQNGAIVMADTNVILTDGTKYQGCKVAAGSSKYGHCIMANAADDGNAASTLGQQLISDFKSKAVRTFANLELLMAKRMTAWARAFNGKPPSTQFVFAAYLSGESDRLNLYFLEPPNTVLLKSDIGYVAVGTGAAITDPLHKALVRHHFHPAQLMLKYLSYLMYRAKEDGAWCGGQTDALFLKVSGEDPVTISKTDMGRAERLAPQLEWVLHEATLAVMGTIQESKDQAAEQLARLIIGQEEFRALTFWSIDGRKIIGD